jgi:hypothetical protein
MIAGCGQEPGSGETNVTETSRQMTTLAERTGLVFPKGVKVLGAKDESGLDGAIFAKLELSPEQWRDLLAASPLAEEQFSDSSRYLLGPDDGWWDPKKPQSLPTAQSRLERGGVLNIGVDRTNAAAFVVYVLWHQT